MKKYTINDIHIFIPTFNRPKFLEKSIQSLINQTAGVPKITVFNNGTMEETSEVIASFKEYGVVEQKSQGSFLDTMDKVSKTVETDFLMIFHDDDILNKNYLDYAIKALNKHENVVMITTLCKDFFEENTINPDLKTSEAYYCYSSKKEVAQLMYLNERIALQPTIYKSEIFKNCTAEEDKYGKFFDWPFMASIAQHGKTIIFNDDNMFYARIHKGQWTNDEKTSWTVQQMTAWHKFFFDSMNADDKNSFGYYYFYTKFEKIFKGGYKFLICDKLKKEYPIRKALKYAKETIGFDSKDVIYNETCLIPILKQFLREQNLYQDLSSTKSSPVYELSELKRRIKNRLIIKFYAIIKDIIKQTFSFKNSYDKKHKIFYILGFKIKIKRKRKNV